MRVVVFGHGVVGQATGLIFERAGFSPSYWDVVPERRTCEWRDATAADVILLCLSAMKSVEDDSEILRREVWKLDDAGFQGIFVQRTTCAPGTADELCEDCDLYDRYVCWPEFLRQAYWQQDALRPYRVVIGSWAKSRNSGVDLIEDVNNRVTNVPVHYVTARQAELVKLISNTLLALRISFWHEIGLQHPELDQTVMDAVTADSRLESFAIRIGAPYGGACLPKDAALMAKLVPSGVIAATDAVNRRLIEMMKTPWGVFRVALMGNASREREFANWLAGFIAGEGHFRVNEAKNENGAKRYVCQFRIAVRDDDETILNQVIAATGIGRLRKRKSVGASKPQAVWDVFTKQDCLNLVTVLDTCPIRAKKSRDYAIWRQAVHCWASTDKSRDWSQMKEYKRLLEATRVYKQPSAREIDVVNQRMAEKDSLPLGQNRGG